MKIITKLSIAIFILFVSCSSLTKVFAEAPTIIKFATVVPEGSTWTNTLREIDKELRSKSNGNLRLKIYAGGVQGDEVDIIRKMRIGQIHSAGFTGVGLGDIVPEVRIFDLPFFLRNYEEVDFIRNKFHERFVNKFDDKGYVMLGWTEVGFIYFYSNIELRNINALRSTKMWMWEGDPLVKALFDNINLTPIPLTITDVISSLQTGLIDSVYVSPLGMIALQWFQKVKYAMNVPMADATGAILISKKEFNKLSPKFQKLLKSTFATYCNRLMDIIRNDNEVSINVLEDSGISFVQMDKVGIRELEIAGEKARKALSGKLYTVHLLNDVTKALDEFRSKTNTSYTYKYSN